VRRMWWRFLAWRYRRMAASLEREAERLREAGYSGLAVPTARLAAEFREKARGYNPAGHRATFRRG
jgi:hypothetical protein